MRYQSIGDAPRWRLRISDVTTLPHVINATEQHVDMAVIERASSRHPAGGNNGAHMQIARYAVVGVDRASGSDVEWVIEAASEENARAKGELRGAVVTAVKRFRSQTHG